MLPNLLDLLTGVQGVLRPKSEEHYKNLRITPDVPCSKCGKGDRHKNKVGVLISSMCAKCYRANAKKYNDARKEG